MRGQILTLLAGAVAAVVFAMGINRVVVTDGHIPATLTGGADVAFKSDYFKLDG